MAPILKQYGCFFYQVKKGVTAIMGNMKDSVDLYTALKLIGVFDQDGELVLMRSPEDQPEYRVAKRLTVKQLKDGYDLRKAKVVNIRPYFCCHEYDGLLLTVVDGEEARHGRN